MTVTIMTFNETAYLYLGTQLVAKAERNSDDWVTVSLFCGGNIVNKHLINIEGFEDATSTSILEECFEQFA